MTVSEVEKYRYWADEYGNIWRRESWCAEPTVEFVRLSSPGPSCDEKPMRLGGGIYSPNLSGLKPVELPVFPERAP